MYMYKRTEQRTFELNIKCSSNSKRTNINIIYLFILQQRTEQQNLFTLKITALKLLY